MSKSSKRPMKSWFNAKAASSSRRQRNREYTHKREKHQFKEEARP